MPKNVRRFAWLYWAAFLIVLIGVPPLWVASWTAHAVITQLIVVAATALISAVIFFPLFWLAVWRRRNWARWILLLAFVASVPFGFVNWPGERLPVAGIGVTLLSNLVAALAFYFVFTGDARAWFQPENSK